MLPSSNIFFHFKLSWDWLVYILFINVKHCWEKSRHFWSWYLAMPRSSKVEAKEKLLFLWLGRYFFSWGLKLGRIIGFSARFLWFKLWIRPEIKRFNICVPESYETKEKINLINIFYFFFLTFLSIFNHLGYSIKIYWNERYALINLRT